MSYPVSLISLTNPTNTDRLGSSTVPHTTQHANLNNELTALFTQLITNGTLYLGGSTTDGSWRIRLSGDDLYVEHYETDTWIEYVRIEGA